MNELGIRIKQQRLENRLKQKELAELVGISNTYLSDIETGRTNPSIETLKKIAQILNIRVSNLLD